MPDPRGADQVLGEGDADDVVEALVEDRDAAVAGLDGTLEDSAGLEGLLDGDYVGPRHHDLSHDRVAELDDRVDQHPLIALNRLVERRHIGKGEQLGLGHIRLAPRAAATWGYEAGKADEGAGDDPCGREADEVGDKRCRQQRRSVGVAHRPLLWDRF